MALPELLKNLEDWQHSRNNDHEITGDAYGR